ncbi:MAG: ABC transporter ATP-binding protein [Siculibacillus sp.]
MTIETEPFALRFADVVHGYRGKVALRGVSLDLRPGEILALLGPSGCGKTTLLRVAAGLERPRSGRVEIAGRTMADDDVFVAPEKRGIGLVFQDYALFPHLDVGANVAFGLGRRPGAEGLCVARELLARVGLADRVGAYPHMLSGGEQQRVALARALAPSPAVLLMDEPFSNLDQRLRRGMRAETVDVLRASGAAAVLVTHDPDDAMAVADRIALMRDGRLVQVGTAEEVFRRPVDLFAAKFFTDLEELPATVRDGRAETPLGSFAAPGLADGPSLLCIRRDAFTLGAEEAEFSARVVALRFLGEHWAVGLAIDGVARPVEAMIDARLRLSVGERVAVTIDRREAFVFADPAH